ncbi:hypothetical protein WJX81_005729 [Elliptochloris bilobata]|uniref:cysteine--tRNA ligase n=1 Tax=Elliptochloris bilobata TaxID=381761 RepID=A0AAW1QK41_9CHLO
MGRTSATATTVRAPPDAALAPAAQAEPEAAHPLVLYNTMTRQKQRFSPRPDQGSRVSLYCCGVTVYDYSHIGHARVYCCFDVLVRMLRHLGYSVTYVRNFTDIDDKIIARAREAGEDPLALARRFIAEFHADMAALKCAPPDLEPRATDYVGAMVAAIQRIVANGHGYEASGDVFFSVDSVDGYGRLSGRSLEDNRAGERVAVSTAKRNPADFVLWKAAKPGEPTWDSPWGPGRPGWHIECSAMIRELMGPLIDIHGGGRDLIHPHHDNELVQSQAACNACDVERLQNGRDFVRWWMHNGFVNVDSEKMSKSLGNFFTIRDVLKRYHALSLRWFLVATHYRAAVNYSPRGLEEASDRLYYIFQTLADAEEAYSAAGDNFSAATRAAAAADVAAGRGAGGALAAEVRSALCDDLNTPMVVSAMSAPLKALNDLLHTKKGKKAPNRLATIAGVCVAVKGALDLLGLQHVAPQALLAELRMLALVRAELSEADVEAAIAERAAARAAKEFAAADDVRLRLAERGIMLMDSAAGTAWRPGVLDQSGV